MATSPASSRGPRSRARRRTRRSSPRRSRDRIATTSQLGSLVASGVQEGRELFFAVALDDVRRAAAILRPAYERSGGRDGFVSFECTPDVADDTEATVAQALELWHRLDLPNVLIKVPATRAGVGAIEELTARGVNVNVTLLFSVERYEEVIEAYLRGLERRVDAGLPVQGIASVASFFVSRIDAKADAVLAPDSALRGRVAIANAHHAYGRYLAPLRRRALGGARAAPARAPQRPLWASTGTKDPSYSDVLYVERLIAPGVINTMPLPTLRAFADHGNVEPTLGPDLSEALRRPLRPPPPKASTSTRSPPSWNATASRPSATPTPSCCAASKASAAH